jgi:hypothetical protein
MKTYIVKTMHDVYLDDYNEGEGNYANSYDLKEEVKAETPQDAIQQYFDKHLGYKFNIIDAYIPHKEEEDAPKNVLHYSVLVDENNVEVTSKEEIKLWQEGKKQLYSNHIYLLIYQTIHSEI